MLQSIHSAHPPIAHPTASYLRYCPRDHCVLLARIRLDRTRLLESQSRHERRGSGIDTRCRLCYTDNVDDLEHWLFFCPSEVMTRARRLAVSHLFHPPRRLDIVHHHEIVPDDAILIFTDGSYCRETSRAGAASVACFPLHHCPNRFTRLTNPHNWSDPARPLYPHTVCPRPNWRNPVDNIHLSPLLDVWDGPNTHDYVQLFSKRIVGRGVGKNCGLSSNAAELFAVMLGIMSLVRVLAHYPRWHTTPIIFCCDSTYVCNTLARGDSLHHDTNNPFISSLLISLTQLSSHGRRPIRFHWLKGHVGIRGNVLADRHAGRAMNSIHLPIAADTPPTPFPHAHTNHPYLDRHLPSIRNNHPVSVNGFSPARLTSSVLSHIGSFPSDTGDRFMSRLVTGCGNYVSTLSTVSGRRI